MADESNQTSIQAAAAAGISERIKSMSFVEFMLTLLMASLLAGLGYGVPWISNEIKSFGKDMETAHREERKAAEESHAATIKGLQSTFTDTLDRLERRVKDREAGAVAKGNGGQ